MDIALSPPRASYATLAPPHLIGLGLILLALPLLLWQFVQPGQWVVPPVWFLSFHTLVEGSAIVAAAVIFITGWHVLDEKRPRASVMLACAFLVVALQDYAHLMSYQGMTDFITPNTPHKAILFWLAGRLTAAAALLAYVVLPHDPRRHAPSRRALLAGSLAFTLLLWGVGLFRPEWIPATFVAGQGLSFFKLAMEAVVVVLGVATLALVWRRRAHLGFNQAELSIALGLMVMGELFFMVYESVTDVANMIGHVYKVASYIYLYRAMHLESVLAPMARLRMARQEILEGARRFEELLENAPDAVMVAGEDGRILMVNSGLERLFGYDRRELLGQPVEILLPESIRARHREHRVAYMGTSRERPMSSVPNMTGRHKTGREIPVDIALSRFDSGGGCRITAFIRDVSDRRRMETEIRHQATHDTLTGLPNRILFLDRLDVAMAHARRHGGLGAVMMLDLDDFKSINDVLGHGQGDLLLQEAAHRLSDCLRAEDTVARLGGDEFAILLPALERPEDAQAVADKLIAVLSQPFHVEGLDTRLGASVGITLFPLDGDTSTTLLRNADMSMYRAKTQGRACACYYTPDMHVRLQDNLLLQSHMRQALERGEFHLHYQPQAEIASGAISGVEALLRWSHPQLGEISPARFIPVAEACGLIVPLGNWVIHAACAQIAAWEQAGTPVRVGVNISAHQFRQGELARQIKASLAASGATPGLLELELTESALMEDMDGARTMFDELGGLGVRIAIDDFGTGYSSLAYLKRFRLHTLKLDRAFVSEMDNHERDESIVRAVVDMAHSLGFQVIAEGVEREAQRRRLAELGCDVFQGWLFSRALPVQDMAGVLRHGKFPLPDQGPSRDKA